MSHPRPILVYYEHPDWFRPLFSELERRGIPHRAVDASRHRFDPSSADDEPLVFNRMSPSAWKRGCGHAILYTLHYLRHLERAGAPVFNGLDAFTVETSKALQIALIEELGLAAPRTIVVDHPEALEEAAESLEFPLVVKPNIGGSGAGIIRFDSRDELHAAIEQGRISTSIDGILLLQEFHPPEGGSIVRVETLEGRTLYGIRVHIGEGAGFDLCPADICRDVSGAELVSSACPAGAAKAGLTVEAYAPPPTVRLEVEAIASSSRLDVGGIEYLVSARDGRRYYYDVNALSNFVADATRVVGFDPTARLVDTLVRRASTTAPAVRARRDRRVTRTHRAAPAAAGPRERDGLASAMTTGGPIRSVASFSSALSEEIAPASYSAGDSVMAPFGSVQVTGGLP